MKIKSEKDFLNDINSFKLDPVYLLIGSDTERKKNPIILLKSKISGDFDFLNITSQSESIDMILSDLLTPPLFAPKRVIVLDNFEKLKATNKKNILSYIQNPLKSTVLFLLHNEDLKTYEIKKEYEQYENITIVLFNPLTEDEIKDIVIDFFNKNDIKPETGVIEYISNSIINFSQLKNELQKLSLYLETEKNLTLKQVKDLIFPLKETPVYEISDDIIFKNKERFKNTLNNLISQKEEPLYIIAAIENTIEKILKAKTLLKKYTNPPYEICQMLSINRFEIEKLKQTRLESFSNEKLLKALELCLEAENTLKSSTFHDSYIITKNVAYFIIENLMNS